MSDLVVETAVDQFRQAISLGPTVSVPDFYDPQLNSYVTDVDRAVRFYGEL
jgi:hypothetical protein